jgi:hypothetical protein
MATIELEGGTVLLDDDELERLEGRSVYLGSNGYAYFSKNATGPITLHSFVMGGATPGMHIDHANGNPLDNRKSNLRVVTAQANQVNRKRLSRANTSGRRGVTVRRGAKNPYIAQITVLRKTIYLGSFPDLEEAVAARKKAELEYYGEECP